MMDVDRFEQQMRDLGALFAVAAQELGMEHYRHCKPSEAEAPCGTCGIISTLRSVAKQLRSDEWISSIREDAQIC